MRTIYKYEVKTEMSLELPEGYNVLSVQTQDSDPMMWVEVNTSNPMKTVKFLSLGTGHPIDEDLSLKFIGTHQVLGGMFVFHLFEVLEG